MTMLQKILATHSDQDQVQTGDVVVVTVDRAVLLDMCFYEGIWVEPRELVDPDKAVLIFDHIVPAPDQKTADYLDQARAFARRVGITHIHDIGPEQGICHEIIANVPYALPGQILVCPDSHTISAGAMNNAARGLGVPEIVSILAKGYTWYEVGPTIRYELSGSLRPGVSPKDLFLTIASEFGSHEGCTAEIGGSGLASLSIDQRRQLTTMFAEVSADFAICEPDEVLAAHLAARDQAMDGAVWPDDDAVYQDVRAIDLGSIETMVGLPDALVNNTAPVSQVAGTTINRAFIGSCANGTLQDLRDAARVLDGRKVDPRVTLVVTPASQAIYLQAVREGIAETIMSAGALMTVSSCGMCGGFENALGREDVCITSSTRNFKGRMGHNEAQIYMGSSATVAASAVAGSILGESALQEVSA